VNLRDGKGKVPVYVGGDSPYILVAFPDKETFFQIFKRTHYPGSKEKFWEVLTKRAAGATLAEAGKPYMTKEGVLKIEARFLRLFREAYVEKLSSKRKPLGKDRTSNGSR